MTDLALLKPKLSRLKLSGMLESLQNRLEQAMKEKWSFTEFLDILITDEAERRDFKQLSRRLAKSELDPTKTYETFDFSFNRKIPETTLKELSMCQFIGKKQNVFLVGPSGVGKSHLAQALGHEAVRRGNEILFRRTNILFKWIHSGQADGSHERKMKMVINIPLLILDDFGLSPLTEEQQMDLYEVICERYEKRSTIITSNRDFSEWASIFSNPLMASAAMDRLVHRALKIEIHGNSYRMDNFIKESRTLTTASKKV
ncbi:MAG: hypothetical protein CVU43_23065 [Chloroflexi bacterium HGW-Chloroflexi-5]|nr:MAG: hypothetical protein CVU43_23065 [Chloroflexi bacterium HGW-Chloroflexi-5]